MTTTQDHWRQLLEHVELLDADAPLLLRSATEKEGDDDHALTLLMRAFAGARHYTLADIRLMSSGRRDAYVCGLMLAEDMKGHPLMKVPA